MSSDFFRITQQSCSSHIIMHLSHLHLTSRSYPLQLGGEECRLWVLMRTAIPSWSTQQRVEAHSSPAVTMTLGRTMTCNSRCCVRARQRFGDDGSPCRLQSFQDKWRFSSLVISQGHRGLTILAGKPNLNESLFQSARGEGISQRTNNLPCLLPVF